MIKHAVFPKPPLVPAELADLPLGAVRPEGWLRDQLELMASTITGRLDEVWPQVGEGSGWRGGDGEDWERTPYWLDGLVPLAYLLRDRALIAKAKLYLSWIIDQQTDEGQIGPAGQADWWPRAVALKALWSYYTATGSRSALLCMLRFARYMLLRLGEQPLEHWARARALEFFTVLMPLYALTERRYLLKLMEAILEQSLDWTGNFAAFRFNKPTAQLMSWEDLKNRSSSDDYHATHVVNNAMALKYPALHHALTGNVKAALYDLPWERLMRYHGQAHGLFSGDEHLAGRNPSQGTETCAVVEAMYSLERLMALTGDPILGDRLERLAFNALPAALTPDGWGHQYLQQVNQIAAARGRHGWYNDGEDANAFGLEPNYGCCTANLHQGWPKYAASLWMAHRDGGLCALSYAPCRVSWSAGGVPVAITVNGSYPQHGDISISVTPEAPARFAVRLRIPGWAKDATAWVGETSYDAPCGGFAVIDREWREGDVISLYLPMAPRVETGYHQSASVYYGPLLMAMPLAERWVTVAEHGACADREVKTDDAWAYALLPERSLTASGYDQPMGRWKQGEPPVTITATCAPVSWPRLGDDAAPPPVLPLVSEGQAQRVTLVPYASTSLRIALFPTGRAEGQAGATPAGAPPD